MTNTRHDKLISIIGFAYLQPITDLIDRMFSLRSIRPSNSVKTNERENGYAVSICLLTVACFESISMRVRHLCRNSHTAANNERHAVEFLQALYPSFKRLDAIKEVYVIRDSIIHNHLWELGFYFNVLTPMEISTATKSPLSGNKKYLQCVNLRTRKTKTLGLHVVPIRIDRTDVLKVLDTVWQYLKFLEGKDINYCQPSNQYVYYKGKHIKFEDLIRMLKTQSRKHRP